MKEMMQAVTTEAATQVETEVVLRAAAAAVVAQGAPTVQVKAERWVSGHKSEAAVAEAR